VREIVARELRGKGLEVSTDGLGSVIGVLRGSSNGPRIHAFRSYGRSRSDGPLRSLQRAWSSSSSGHVDRCAPFGNTDEYD
jgi:hypothetical protein